MRHLLGGLFAVTLLAASAAPVRADLAGPWPWSRVPQRPPHSIPFSNAEPASPAPAAEPQLQQGAIDPVSGLPYPPPLKPDPPKRTGPFRSCGSGMGVGLAGIGVAGMLLWLGNRCAGRVARGK